MAMNKSTTWRDKRPPSVRTEIRIEEVRLIFGQQFWHARDEMYHVRNAKGFLKYYESGSCEDESYIVEYFKRRAKLNTVMDGQGIGPFDLISDSKLYQIIRVQAIWRERCLQLYKAKRLKSCTALERATLGA
jgi:hypothetical protein